MKYIIGVIAIILIAIGAILLLVIRTPDVNDQNENADPAIDLTEYIESGTSVTFTVEGELTALEERRAIRVSVSQDTRTIEIINGYNGGVVKRQTLSNDSSAYDEFLHGLKYAGFSRNQEAAFEDETGVCASGRRFIYELRQNGDDTLRLWSTSCDRDDGSFAGNRSQVERLFEEQIPDYRDFVRGVDL